MLLIVHLTYVSQPLVVTLYQYLHDFLSIFIHSYILSLSFCGIINQEVGINSV